MANGILKHRRADAGVYIRLEGMGIEYADTAPRDYGRLACIDIMRRCTYLHSAV
jgi:hypothetical protein